MKYKVTVKTILDYERRMNLGYGWQNKSVCEVFLLSEIIETQRSKITRKYMQFDLDCMRCQLEVNGWRFNSPPELLQIVSIEKVPKDTKLTTPNNFVIEAIIKQEIERSSNIGFYTTTIKDRMITDRKVIKEVM